MSRAAPGPEDRHAQSRGTDSGGAATGCAEAVVPARPPGRARAALAGLRAPVVWVLLAIAYFTAISGKPVDGVLMLIVAAGLAWDAGRRALRHPESDERPRGPAGPPGRRPPAAPDGERATGRWRGLRRGGGLVQPLLLARDGGHHRGGHGRGPDRLARPAAGPPGAAGGCRWPAPSPGSPCSSPAACGNSAPCCSSRPLTTDSYTHPTVSTLTDPVLATAPGRSVVLLAWLALGWYLVER